MLKFINMKKIFTLSLLFILFFSFTSFSQSLTKQEAIEFAEKLEDVEILSEKGRVELIRKIKANKLIWEGHRESVFFSDCPHFLDNSKASILNFCYNIFTQEYHYRTGRWEAEKIIQEVSREISEETTVEEFNTVLEERLTNLDGTKIESGIVPEEGFQPNPQFNAPPFNIRGLTFGLLHKNRSVLGKTTFRTLQNLLEIDLINETTYNKILAREISSEIDVLKLAHIEATALQKREKDFQMDSTYLQALFDVDLFSKDNFEKVKQAYKLNKFKDKYGLIPYCNNVLRIPKEKLELGTELFLEYLFEDLKSFIPKFNKWSVEIESDTIFFDKGVFEWWQLGHIRFEYDREVYSTKFVFDGQFRYPKVEWIKKDIDKYSLSLVRKIVREINDVLFDNNSSNRVFGLNLLETDESFYLSQFDINQFYFWDFSPFSYNEFNECLKLPTIEEKEAIFQEMLDLGLLNHLTKKQLKQGKKKAMQSKLPTYYDIYFSYPRLLAKESLHKYELDELHKYLCITLGKVSRGHFTPINVATKRFRSNENHNSYIEVSFEFNGKFYRKEIYNYFRFVDVVNNILQENRIDGRFYKVEEFGDIDGFIFLTVEQYVFFEKHLGNILNPDLPDLTSFSDFN